MSRATIIINSHVDRARIANWASKAPPGTRVEWKAPRRTLDQNAKMWAMLTDVARQIEWHGQKLSTEDWKVIFLHALKQELRTVPGIDGNSIVHLGRSSSDLTKEEMSDLIEVVAFFGATHGVKFGDMPE